MVAWLPGWRSQEYKIINVTARFVNYVYACCPSEPWPGIIYTISLSRVQMFYNTVIIAPTIIVTMLSFAVFWADTGSADALGYGITVIVVNLLSNIVLIGMLPVCVSPASNLRDAATCKTLPSRGHTLPLGRARSAPNR